MATVPVKRGKTVTEILRKYKFARAKRIKGFHESDNHPNDHQYDFLDKKNQMSNPGSNMMGMQMNIYPYLMNGTEMPYSSNQSYQPYHYGAQANLYNNSSIEHQHPTPALPLSQPEAVLDSILGIPLPSQPHPNEPQIPKHAVKRKAKKLRKLAEKDESDDEDEPEIIITKKMLDGLEQMDNEKLCKITELLERSLSAKIKKRNSNLPPLPPGDPPPLPIQEPIMPLNKDHITKKHIPAKVKKNKSQEIQIIDTNNIKPNKEAIEKLEKYPESVLKDLRSELQSELNLLLTNPDPSSQPKHQAGLQNDSSEGGDSLRNEAPIPITSLKDRLGFDKNLNQVSSTHNEEVKNTNLWSSENLQKENLGYLNKVSKPIKKNRVTFKENITESIPNKSPLHQSPDSTTKVPPFSAITDNSPSKINRPDLDSRINNLFGEKCSEQETQKGPETTIIKIADKTEVKSTIFSGDPEKLLVRPPSPFKSKEAYYCWHKRTIHFKRAIKLGHKIKYCDPKICRVYSPTKKSSKLRPPIKLPIERPKFEKEHMKVSKLPYLPSTNKIESVLNADKKNDRHPGVTFICSSSDTKSLWIDNKRKREEPKSLKMTNEIEKENMFKQLESAKERTLHDLGLKKEPLNDPVKMKKELDDLIKLKEQLNDPVTLKEELNDSLRSIEESNDSINNKELLLSKDNDKEDILNDCNTISDKSLVIIKDSKQVPLSLSQKENEGTNSSNNINENNPKPEELTHNTNPTSIVEMVMSKLLNDLKQSLISQFTEKIVDDVEDHPSKKFKPN